MGRSGFLNILFILAISILLTSPVMPQSPQSSLILPSGVDYAVYNRAGSVFILDRQKLLGERVSRRIEKLSAGLRIVTPSDDPAGFAVSENMEKILGEVRQRIVNDEDMRNYVNYAESAMGHDQQVLVRMRELLLRASNGILNSDDRELIQSEVDQLRQEIDMQAQYASFNGKRVIPDLTVTGLGLDKVSAVTGTEASLGMIDAALSRISRARAILGSRDNILRLRIKGKSVYYVNLASSMSRISDLDMAEEISRLAESGALLKTSYGILILKNK
ncbi:MAG: hypothetical protein CVV44_08735 [Spirochaetae bacterium HGW-Spirochaetae-1]|jgi:flagellin|nr:MAG: hypothetical protein CVV44_08735 [Spirochaetae bacterium HGW-Spirochaetae-1]